MVKLKFSRRLRSAGRKTGRKNDKVLILFEDLSGKTAVLEALWDQPRPVIKGQHLGFYSHICPLTLRRQR